jgi:hypothetical protein
MTAAREFQLSCQLEDNTDTMEKLDLEMQEARRLWAIIRAGDAALREARDKLQAGALTAAKDERTTAAYAFHDAFREAMIAVCILIQICIQL